MRNKNILSIDFGGMSIKYSLINNAREIDEVITDSKEVIDSHESAAKDVLAKLNTLEDKHGKIHGIAISFNSPVIDEVKVRWGVISGKWVYKNFEEILYKIGVDENIPITIINDAKAALFAESKKGSAKGYKNAVMLTFGTAIGGAALIEGKLVNGRSALGAELSNPIMQFDGETFNSIKLQHSFASMTTFENRYKQYSGVAKKGKEIFELFDAGDLAAKKAVNNLYMGIAAVIYNSVYSYGQEVTVIGGGISNRDAFVDEISKYMVDLSNSLQMEIPTKIVLSSVKNKAGNFGAYYYFLERININEEV